MKVPLRTNIKITRPQEKKPSSNPKLLEAGFAKGNGKRLNVLYKRKEFIGVGKNPSELVKETVVSCQYSVRSATEHQSLLVQL